MKEKLFFNYGHKIGKCKKCPDCVHYRSDSAVFPDWTLDQTRTRLHIDSIARRPDCAPTGLRTNPIARRLSHPTVCLYEYRNIPSVHMSTLQLLGD